jgi:hypothetical protein
MRTTPSTAVTKELRRTRVMRGRAIDVEALFIAGNLHVEAASRQPPAASREP